MERLSEPEFEHRLLGIAPEEFYGAVVIPHDLAGQRESDAGAFLFRGEERDEDLLLGGYGYRFPVVAIFTVVDMVILWTYGVTLTWPVTEEKKPFSLKGLKNLISAPVIAMILSAVFVICGWKLPGVLSSTLSSVGSTSMPLALIYIGGALYGSDFRSMLKRPELYAGIAVKMAALPLAVFVILRAIGSGSEIAGMFAIAVSLPGIELIPMMAKANGSNGEYALGAIMLSTIASLATIPLVSLGISLLQ